MTNPDIIKSIVALLALMLMGVGIHTIARHTMDFLYEHAREMIGLAFVLELAGFTWLVYTVFEYMGL